MDTVRRVGIVLAVADGYYGITEAQHKGSEMYEVKATGEKFDNFMKAVRAADAIKSDVFEVATGLRRWAPAAPVSRRRMRQYNEQRAAYAAQESIK